MKIMDAYAFAMDAQNARVSAECAVGAAERDLYEARLSKETGAISAARSRLRAARRDLHRAIDGDRAAYSDLMAAEETAARRRVRRQQVHA